MFLYLDTDISQNNISLCKILKAKLSIKQSSFVRCREQKRHIYVLQNIAKCMSSLLLLLDGDVQIVHAFGYPVGLNFSRLFRAYNSKFRIANTSVNTKRGLDLPKK